MTQRHIKATIKDDVIVPKTHLDLPDGTEVEVDVDVPDTERKRSQKTDLMQLAGSVNSFKDIHDPVAYQRKLRQAWDRELD